MEGIDVSSYQGDIDWSKIKGVDFVYIKSGQGINAPDTKCLLNAHGVSQTPIKFGYYHFATLNQSDVFSDAKEEASQFIAQLRTLPHPSLICALDIELNNQLNLTPSQVENWIHSYINTMNGAGYKTILYSGKAFLDGNLPKNHTLGQYPLWIANYTHNSFPSLPLGWNSYNIWQYSQTGNVEGISGNVDLNHARLLV